MGSRSLRIATAAPAAFLLKTYDMVDDPATEAIVSWSNGNNSFVVWQVHEFAALLLPKYFKHSNFSSFVRRLNTYGFHKVDPDRWEFASEKFLRGQKNLLRSMTRRKSTPSKTIRTCGVSSTDGAACNLHPLQLFEDEVSIIRRERNRILLEVVRLHDEGEAMNSGLKHVSSILDSIERRHSQMTGFLSRIFGASKLRSDQFSSRTVMPFMDHEHGHIIQELEDGIAVKKLRLECMEEPRSGGYPYPDPKAGSILFDTKGCGGEQEKDEDVEGKGGRSVGRRYQSPFSTSKPVCALSNTGSRAALEPFYSGVPSILTEFLSGEAWQHANLCQLPAANDNSARPLPSLVAELNKEKLSTDFSSTAPQNQMKDVGGRSFWDSSWGM